MGTRDPRVDAYIAKSPEFARPILTQIRDVVHAACPEVQETVKWSHPFFDYKGPMCNMAAFKEHVGFGFWKQKLLDPAKASGDDDSGMGLFGRLKSVRDLPSKKVLTSYVKKAMALNDEGVTVPKRKPAAKSAVAVPPELAVALAKNRKARDSFDAFPPGQRREYCDWIAEAKREETKAARVKQAIEWMAEGKTRNWKYQR